MARFSKFLTRRNYIFACLDVFNMCKWFACMCTLHSQKPEEGTGPIPFRSIYCYFIFCVGVGVLPSRMSVHMCTVSSDLLRLEYQTL